MIDIYGELLFVENLTINYFILALSSKICGAAATKKRLIIGAVVGAVYSFVFFIPSIHFLYSTLMKIIFSCFIVVITFSPNHIKFFFKLLVSFYGSSFALGGLILAGLYFTDMNGLVKNSIFYIRDLSYLKVIILACCGYFMMIYLAKMFRKRILKSELYAEIQIEVDGKKTLVNGIMDTANFLMDPISKMPVIVIEYSALKNFLPEIFQDILREGIVLNEIPENIYEIGWGRRLRFIPFTSLGAKNGMLIGIKPDAVYIRKDRKSYSNKNIIIGIYDGSIGDEDYSALLHPDILKEDAEYDVKEVWNE